jgi:hypothetical protein
MLQFMKKDLTARRLTVETHTMAVHIELSCSVLRVGGRLANARLCSWTCTRQCSSTNSSMFKFTWRPASTKQLGASFFPTVEGCNLWSTAPSRQTSARFERNMHDNRVPACAPNSRVLPFLLHLLQPFYCYSACVGSSRMVPRPHFSPSSSFR